METPRTDESAYSFVHGPIAISVIVHTRNEEGNIADCLESCIGWADEVIVADMESSDATRKIAISFGAEVIALPYEDEFDRARNDSVLKAKNEWILYLDADERLTPEVRSTIERLILSAMPEVGAFQIPYRVVSFGSWIRHAGGWWPSYKSPALLRNGRFHFPGGVHIPAVVHGQTVRVAPSSPEDAILHFSHPNLDRYFAKLNSYTTLEVRKRERVGIAPSWESVADGLGGAMRWYYDDTEGRRDGLAGFLLSLGSGMYEAASGMKHLELARAGSIPDSATEFFERALLATKRVADRRDSHPDWATTLCAWCAQTANGLVSQGRPVMQLSDVQAGALERVEEGTFVLVRDGTLLEEGEARSLLAASLGADVHLLTVDGHEERWWFGWKDVAVATGPSVCSCTHANALSVMGGGEVQLFQSVKALRRHGVVSDIKVGGGMPTGYDLCHVYSLHHPAPSSSNTRYVLSPIFWDRSELAWVAPKVVSLFSRLDDSTDVDAGFLTLRADATKRRQTFTQSLDDCTAKLVAGAAMVLPNADCEQESLRRSTGLPVPIFRVVPNAHVHSTEEEPDTPRLPDEAFVLCVGRIEHNKNQLSLVWALRGSKYKIVLIGAEHDAGYADQCKRVGGDHVVFLGAQPPALVHAAMRKAAVHCLPSFGETPGIANLEAASHGCPIVVGDRAAEREYFGEGAWYVDPLDPVGIRMAVEDAAVSKGSDKVRELQDRVVTTYTWEAVAESLAKVYRDVLFSP